MRAQVRNEAAGESWNVRCQMHGLLLLGCVYVKYHVSPRTQNEHLYRRCTLADRPARESFGPSS